MVRWTTGRMMRWIAGLAVGLAGLIWLDESLSKFAHPHHRYLDCASNERNIALSILGYVNSRGSFPRGTYPNPALAPEFRVSWYYHIANYLDYQGLSQEIDPTGPWSSPANDKVATMRIFVTCPDAPQRVAGGYVPTSYIGMAGLGVDAPILPVSSPRAGIFGYDRQTTPADVRDGMAFTMMLAESGRARDSWLAGGPATVRGLDTTDMPYIGSGRQFGGMHRVHGARGAYVAFADGSIRFIPDTIHPRIFEAFSTIAGGETIPRPPW